MNRALKNDWLIWCSGALFSISVLLVDLLAVPTSLASTFPDQLSSLEDRISECDTFIYALIQIESGGNTLAVGSKGERGLMQIKQDTWNEVSGRLFGRPVSFEQAFDPSVNKKVGQSYLMELERFLDLNASRMKSDKRSVLLAAYNAGPGGVEKAGFDLRRMSASVQDYVCRVSAIHDLYLNGQLNAMSLTSIPGQPQG